MTGLGIPRWFAQLRRPLCSAFHHVYQHAQRSPADVSAPLSAQAWGELLLFGRLSPLAEADLTADWHPHIMATDASSVFGFGVMTAPATSGEAAHVGRLASTADQFVRVTDLPGTG